MKNKLFQIQYKPRAIKDLKNIKNPKFINFIFERLDYLANGLQGDIKKLTNFSQEYRLRIGDYRVLFEIIGKNIIIYRILHRKEVYR